MIISYSVLKGINPNYYIDANMQGSPPPPLVGNKYILCEEIGRGRFGIVYKGEHVKYKTNVAIKMEHCKNECNTIKYESTILNYLYSSGCRVVPAVLWYGIYGDFKCLTMDYYDQSIADYIDIARTKYSNSPIDYFKQTIKLLVNMVNILAQVHKHQIIHRDIKPENFMIKNGQIHLLDFGIAISVVSTETINREPYRDTIIGSPKYVSFYIHDGYEPMYRDDLISVGYCFFYFINDELPWANVPVLENTKTNTQNVYSEIHIFHEKNRFRKKAKPWANIEILMDNLIKKWQSEKNTQYSQLFSNVFEYFSLCYGLQIHEIPYYDELCQVLQQSL
jgi:casein kinase 1